METGTVNLSGVTINNSYGIGTASNEQVKEQTKGRAKDKEDGQVKNGSIYAGNIHSMMSKTIEQKREQARKQAANALLGQFASDQEIIDDMDELRARNREIKDEMSELNEEKKFFKEQQEALRERYGVAADSEEQKELELISKARKAMRNGTLGSLTKEELEQVANMGELTEYQQRALEYEDIIGNFDKAIEGLKRETISNNYDIRVDKTILTMTSYKGINAAKEVAETVLDSASDEIRGMLWEEAKKHVEEEMDKLVEEAKEKAKEKEALEEKTAKAEEKLDEQEKLTEEIKESAAQQENLQSELDKIVKEAELLKEDLLGLVVDDIV